MIRGTTAQFKFKLPYPKSELAWATIKFWQPGNNGTLEAPLPITKRLEHCTAADDSDVLCISLTAEETSRFSDKFKAKTQLRAQASDGTTFASRQQIITVYPINDDIIMDDPTMPGEDEEGWIVLDGETIM
jgi:hypothetical protein